MDLRGHTSKAKEKRIRGGEGKGSGGEGEGLLDWLFPDGRSCLQPYVVCRFNDLHPRNPANLEFMYVLLKRTTMLLRAPLPASEPFDCCNRARCLEQSLARAAMFPRSLNWQATSQSWTASSVICSHCFIVRRLRLRFVGGAVQMYLDSVDWSIDWFRTNAVNSAKASE